MSAQTDQQFDDWIGTSREQVEHIDSALSAGMSAALDRDDAPPKDGDPLLPSVIVELRLNLGDGE